VLTLGAGWEHVADLDLAVGHDHPVDEQQHELATLLDGGRGQPLRDPSAERLEGGGDPGQLLLSRGVTTKLGFVRGQCVRPLRQVAAAALVLVERDDPPQVGVGEPLELLEQRDARLPERLPPGCQRLGQPPTSLGPRKRRRQVGRRREQRADVLPD
jgi:hypothetical protein